MIIIEGKEQFHIEGPSAVALGKFDGIHLGHKQLLNNLLEQKKLGRKAVIFTFEPSPATFFAGQVIPGLSTKQEKRRFFEEAGIDVLVEFPMNERTAATLPENFIKDILVSMMETVYVTAGSDVSFGDKGKGDYKLLEKLGHELNYQVELIQKVKAGGKEISSSLIRELIVQGKMEEAGRLLGSYYSITGSVVHGNHIGHTLGFPTVNITPSVEKLLPPNGVYTSLIQVEGRNKIYKGITNVGRKPTVSDHNGINAETFIYDFDEDLYGKEIIVSLLSHRRLEVKFGSFEDLKQQLQRDRVDGREYFLNRGTEN